MTGTAWAVFHTMWGAAALLVLLYGFAQLGDQDDEDPPM